MPRFKLKSLALSVTMALVYIPAVQAQEQSQKTGVDSPDASRLQQETQQLDAVIIKSRRLNAAEAAKNKVAEIPGGASVISSEEISRGRTATLEDVLAYQPGVLAQSVGGNDSLKISIRGSGVISGVGVFREGVQFYYDGLYLTGAGGTPYELLGAQGTNYTEVLRGANAFELGSLSVGGAINFVTHNGRTAPGFRTRLEGGSFDYRRLQASYGGVAADDKFDYYVHADSYYNDGYRDNSVSRNHGGVVNLGYQINPQLKTQFIVRHRREFHEDPGALTWAQLKDDPKQANANNKANRSSGYRAGTTWAGFKTTYTFDDAAELDFGVAYHDYPHVNGRDNPGYWDPVGQRSVSGGGYGDWDWHDLNIGVKYSRTDQLFGHESRSTVSFNSTRHILATNKQTNADGHVNKYVSYGGSYDKTLSFGNETELFDQFWLSAGLSAISIKRATNHRYSEQIPTSNLPIEDTYDYFGWAPRLGVRYNFTPAFEVFGNVSRSVAPVLSWRYASSGVVLPLEVQSGNTLEIGARVKNDIFDGSLTLYQIWIHDEILSEAVYFPGDTTPTTVSFNADSPTVHRGIEAALSARLWENTNGGERVVLRQAYTFNDFYYRNNPTFGSNHLPGLPKHVYQAEVQYQHPSGFYGGVNVRAVTRTIIDYANTRNAPGYSIYGASFGYEAPDKTWKAFVDFRNLGDRKYVTAVSPQRNAAGADVAALFPGDGISTFAGVEFRF
jgi:iron complex outermembrane receptor protein